MGSISNPVLLLIPPELLGPVILLMLVAAGLCLVVGARKLGKALAIAALVLPVIGMVMTILKNEFMALMPAPLAAIFAVLLPLVALIAALWFIAKLALGQPAVDQAKGQLLADGIKALARLALARPLASAGILGACSLGWWLI